MKKPAFINFSLLLCIMIGLGLGSCNGSQDNSGSENRDSKGDDGQGSGPDVEIPDFNEDSAYHFIQKQVNFGPRVPNTKPHEKTANWLKQKLTTYGAAVQVINDEVSAFNNNTLYIKNIRATFGPDKPKKILLCAHWDTRPFADMDTARTEEPIPGANDGGSGTAVILEIARQISKKEPNIGIEIILFDGEDYGAPQGKQKRGEDNGYCLGSEKWAKSINSNKYFADYGILLDMVGAKNAVFKREGYSTEHASQVLDKVWNIAYDLGYSNRFSYQKTGPVMDDHVNVIRHANIPTINIIDYDSQRPNGFGDYWHTHADDMSIISKETLKAVGQTVLATIYRERGIEQ